MYCQSALWNVLLIVRFTVCQELQLPIINPERNISFLFSFNATEIHIETRLKSFCLENSIIENDCNKIFEQVTLLRYEYLQQEMLKEEFNKNSTVINTQYIPNPHLHRSIEAQDAEMNNHFKDLYNTQILQTKLDKILLSLTKQLNYILSSHVKYTKMNDMRIVVIHSCTLPHDVGHHRILKSLLQRVLSSHLIDHTIAIYIFNYGLSISYDHLFNASTSLALYHQKIHLIQVSDDISYFEVPTLYLLYHLAAYLHSTAAHTSTTINSQILYLHTKGVSYYPDIYAQIEDWRDFMLYFLVDQHQACYHLLASQELDTLGVNFKTKPRDFRGNYWWVSSDYIVRYLQPLSLLTDDKYTAEKWLLKATRVRVYNFHESEVDHHVTIYPRHLYDMGKEESNEYYGNREEKSAYCRAITLTYSDHL